MAKENISATALLGAIVNSTDDAIVSKDLYGIVTSWNGAAERMFGFAAAEIVGQSITAIIPADRLMEEEHVLRQIRAGKHIDHFETVRQRKDGRRVPVSLTISPIRDSTGAIVGASKIARDITERQAAEALQHDLHRRLQSLIVASATALTTPTLDAVLPAALKTARDLVAADGYAVWRVAPNGDWRVLSSHGISESFASAIASNPGRPAFSRDLLSRPLVVEDVTQSAFLAPRLDAYASEGVRSILVIPLSVGADLLGTFVFYHRARTTIADIDVEVATAVGTFVAAAIRTAELYDQLRRRERTAAFLAEAGRILASSLDYQDTLSRVARVAVPEIADWCAVDIVDETGQVERLAVAHVDPAKLELAKSLQTRYPEDPRSPYGIHEVIRSKAPVMIARIPDELLVAGARDPEHLEIIRALGLCSYMSVPLLARDQVLGVLTFVAAESRREYTEDDLTFAQEIAARGALAIENAHAYEEARRANTLKDEFLATLSHELRTPLNAVVGYTRMLRSNILTDERRYRALEIVERNAGSLGQLVEDILDVSRIVAGKIRLHVQPVDLPRTLADSVTAVQPAADAKGVRIQCIIDPLAPLVSGDSERLQQVFWNLLSNAVKFTARGGRVHLRLERINSHVEIVVSDTGIGIAPEFLPHVFERFRQSDSRFSRTHGGLGLGLAISRQLVEMHGGTIRAESGGVGKGATFRVALPIMIAHDRRELGSDRVHPLTKGATAGRPLPRLDHLRVLAVDDDPDALSLLAEILEDAGATVLTARSGPDAIERLQSERVDVLIADIGMPDMDGFELIRTIRESDSEIRNVPAAALTAYARSEDRTRALAEGFQMHLAKPIEPSELTTAVRRLADGRPKDGTAR